MSNGEKHSKENLFIFQGSKYIRPEIKENQYPDRVGNGPKNSFFYYVIDRSLGSATNAAILEGYKSLVYGRGLYAKPTASNTADRLKLKQILKSSAVRNVINDFVLQNMFSLDITENNKKELAAISHVGIEKFMPEKEDDKGVINNYWFSRDWRDSFAKQNKPIKYPAFNGKPQKRSIYVGRPYQSSATYFSTPKYVAALPYADFEEEAANLYVSSIKNGLSFGFIINVDGGSSWDDEVKIEFQQKIDELLTGSSNASKFIVSFNGQDIKVTVDPVPTNENIHLQWESLTAIATQQLLTAHQVTSPLLFGIRDSSGLGSNANEMDQAEAQMLKRVIAPLQRFLTDSFEEVLRTYDIFLDLEFLPLTEVVAVEDEKTELSKHSKDAPKGLVESLIKLGEDENPENWQLLCSSFVDYDTDDDLHDLVTLQLKTSTGVARPNLSSEQDSEEIKIRYRYVGNPNPEREFCVKMMRANKLYRKEDIIAMDTPGINDGFGLGGTDNYSVWLWKGGGLMSANFPNGTCRHQWQREIYLNKDGGVDVNSPLATTISTSEARRKGYKVPTNDSDVSIKPHNNK